MSTLRLLTFIFPLIAACSSAQNATVSDDALHVKSTPYFDLTGDGTAPAWKNAEWFDLPKLDGPSSSTTRAKILYSDKGVYTLFHCEDKKITSTLREDFVGLWKEDVVEIFYWTDESIPIYFEYELSPYNYELAILVPNFNGSFQGWTPWRYEGEKKTRKATKILKDEKENVTGWMAEVFIPYALLRPLQNIPPKKGTFWRVNMYRIDYDETPSTKWTWKPVKTNFHEYKSFGKIIFE